LTAKITIVFLLDRHIKGF